MAISQTMNNPSDWIFQPYQNDFSYTQTPPVNTFSAAATTSTAISRNNHLSPEQGRVSKPVRRRSRASRRTPTTLLNTDTTNFRAMVQHFTGGPAAGATINYAAGAPASGFHVQYPNQLQQNDHVFMVDNMHGGGRGGGEAAPANGNRGYDGNFML